MMYILKIEQIGLEKSIETLDNIRIMSNYRVLETLEQTKDRNIKLTWLDLKHRTNEEYQSDYY